MSRWFGLIGLQKCHVSYRRSQEPGHQELVAIPRPLGHAPWVDIVGDTSGCWPAAICARVTRTRGTNGTAQLAGRGNACTRAIPRSATRSRDATSPQRLGSDAGERRLLDYERARSRALRNLEHPRRMPP
jgi:hypothetical protein